MRSEAADTLTRTRQQIATKVRELRLARKLTQAELAKQLQISQNRLSEIERGDGSFTAEQLVALLRLFNATVTDFVDEVRDPALELQNALARLGAAHLHESVAVPSAALAGLSAVVREALVDGSPRLVTALAPVLVTHIEQLNLPKLHSELEKVGFERRFGWLVENTLLALDVLAHESGPAGKTWAKLKRRAELPFRLFLDVVGERAPTSGWATPDPLDPTIRSLRTLEEVKRSASKVSERWGIATTLHPEDFAQALRASRRTD